MEDSASAAKTLRSRLENMDPAQLAAVGIEVVPVRSLSLLLLPELNVSVPVTKDDVPCHLKMIEQHRFVA